MVKRRSVKRNAKNARGLGNIFLAATAPFPKSCASHCRFARFNTSAQRGEFHISHDASLQTILSSFRTHVILSVQASSTGTRQLNNAGKQLLLPIKPPVHLLCRSIYDFRFTISSISVVMSKRVFWPPIMG